MFTSAQFGKYLSYKDIAALMAALNAAYLSVDEQAVLDWTPFQSDGTRVSKNLLALAGQPRQSQCYFKYPQEVQKVRRMIYTSNAIEGFNHHISFGNGQNQNGLSYG